MSGQRVGLGGHTLSWMRCGVAQAELDVGGGVGHVLGLMWCGVCTHTELHVGAEWCGGDVGAESVVGGGCTR